MKVTGELDDRVLKKKLKALGPRKVMAASARGINRALVGVRAELSRRVRDDITASAKAVKESISTAQRARASKPEAALKIVFKPIPLKEYRARQVKKGVTIKAYKKGKRTLIRGVFIVGSLGGHVFRRKGEKYKMKRGHYKGRKRQHIFKQMGPSVIKAAGRALPRMEGATREIVGKRIQESLDYEILKAERLKS